MLSKRGFKNQIGDVTDLKSERAQPLTDEHRMSKVIKYIMVCAEDQSP